MLDPNQRDAGQTGCNNLKGESLDGLSVPNIVTQRLPGTFSLALGWLGELSDLVDSLPLSDINHAKRLYFAAASGVCETAIRCRLPSISEQILDDLELATSHDELKGEAIWLSTYFELLGAAVASGDRGLFERCLFNCGSILSHSELKPPGFDRVVNRVAAALLQQDRNDELELLLFKGVPDGYRQATLAHLLRRHQYANMTDTSKFKPKQAELLERLSMVDIFQSEGCSPERDSLVVEVARSAALQGDILRAALVLDKISMGLQYSKVLGMLGMAENQPLYDESRWRSKLELAKLLTIIDDRKVWPNKSLKVSSYFLMFLQGGLEIRPTALDMAREVAGAVTEHSRYLQARLTIAAAALQQQDVEELNNEVILISKLQRRIPQQISWVATAEGLTDRFLPLDVRPLFFRKLRKCCREVGLSQQAWVELTRAEAEAFAINGQCDQAAELVAILPSWSRASIRAWGWVGAAYAKIANVGLALNCFMNAKDGIMDHVAMVEADSIVTQAMDNEAGPLNSECIDENLNVVMVAAPLTQLGALALKSGLDPMAKEIFLEAHEVIGRLPEAQQVEMLSDLIRASAGEPQDSPVLYHR